MSTPNRIKKKFIESNAIDGTKVLFSNNESFNALKSDGSQEVSLFKLDHEDKLQFLEIPKVSSNPVEDEDLSRKAYVDAEVLVEKNRAQAAEAAIIEDLETEVLAREAANEVLQENIDQETLDRIAGDSALDGRLDVIEGSGEGSVAKALVDAKAYTDVEVLSEKTRAEAAEATLQSAIDTEKGRVDAILLASDADKDSFAEIVQLINSVDTENDNAFASYVLSNNAALAAESAARSAADSALQSELDAEEVRALAAESALDARLDVLEADPVTKTYVDGKVSELTSDIVDLDGYAQDIRSDLDDLDGYAQEIRSDLDQEIIDRAAADSAEQAARIAGDNALQSSLNTEIANREAADDVLDAKIDQKHSEALSYTDTKVAALVNSAPEVLDTLKELADALGGDQNFATTIVGQIGAETAAREAADAALDARLDVLEGTGAGSLAFELNAYGERMVSESFTVDAGMISAGYFDLDFKAFAPSMVVSLDRLMLFEGEDFTVSVEGGVSRLTFIGSILPAGDEALAAGDKIKVRYLKDVR